MCILSHAMLLGIFSFLPRPRYFFNAYICTCAVQIIHSYVKKYNKMHSTIFGKFFVLFLFSSVYNSD